MLTRTGVPAILVRRVINECQPVFTAATFAELESRLWLPKFDRYLGMDDRKELLHDAKALAQWIEVPPAIEARTFCRDASDDKFVHAALAAKAQWLVTGDRDLLDMPPVPDLRTLSPAGALKSMDALH